MNLYHLARESAAPPEAQRLVDVFRDHHDGTLDLAVVAPSTEPLGPDTGDTPIDASLWGVLVAPHAECRWRREGDRVNLAVVSEEPIAGLDLHESEVEIIEEAEEPLTWLPATGIQPAGPIRQRLYTLGGTVQQTRTMVEQTR